MAIEWTDDLSVGHSVVDDQHKALIGQLNDLIIVVTQALSEPSVGMTRVVAQGALFFASFKEHSESEESFMRQLWYQRVDAHARHHQLFIDTLRTLLVEDPNLDAIEINLPFIESAVIDHLERDDRDFGEHLKRHGMFGKS